MQVSPVLRRMTLGWSHWCPACEMMHSLPDNGWRFNGDEDKPSFDPSFKHSLVHWSKGVDARGLGQGERSIRICHYIITRGTIQFCIDSWHKRSDIVAMPPLPADAKD